MAAIDTSRSSAEAKYRDVEKSHDAEVRSSSPEIFDVKDQLHRRLGNRQIQVLAIGGTIGTAAFVGIGGALNKAGALSLLMAYVIYACMLGLVNNGMAEMGVYMPVSASFIRHGSHWVDEAWGFMAGWNFFLYEALLIPFEITALSLVLQFWRDDIPPAAICAACAVFYGMINLTPIKYFGEIEFWLCGGKIVLMALVFSFTFVTMCGGNPQRDAYGFSHWNNPGPFVEYISTGSLGRFEGFLAAVWQASFTVVGPEYIAMVAGEAKLPSVTIKNAFKTVYIRFAVMFLGSALCVGIVVSANDPTLVNIVTGATAGAGTGAASPYIIAMSNMGIEVLPHVVNALLVTSIFSAGNTYYFCAMRGLHGLASDGHAPRILRKCNRYGTPIYCWVVVMIFPLISFLQVSSGTKVVLNWLINLVTAGGIITYIVMCVNYLHFYNACKAQQLDRNTLPYKGYLQPWSTWIALVFLICVVTCYGYATFLPGRFAIGDFLSYYAMLFVAILTCSCWKLFKRSKHVNSHEADLVWERPAIDNYETVFREHHTSDGFWREILQMFQRKKST